MKKIICLFICIGSILAVSCSDDDDRMPIKGTIMFSVKDVVFSVAESSRVISITSNSEWTLTNDVSWCTVDPSSGGPGTTMLRIATEALPEATYTDRVANLTANANGVTQSLQVMQTRFPFLELPKEKTVDNTAQKISITGKANYDFQLSTLPYWISLEENADTRNVEDVTLSFQLDYNIGGERDANIIISNYAGTLSDTLHVVQEGGFAINWEPLGVGEFSDAAVFENAYEVAIEKGTNTSDGYTYYKIIDPYSEGLAEEYAGKPTYPPSSEIICYTNGKDEVKFDMTIKPGIHYIYQQIPCVIVAEYPPVFKESGANSKRLNDYALQLSPIYVFLLGQNMGELGEYPITVKLPGHPDLSGD